MSIHLKRTATILKPDQSRVLLRPFSPGIPNESAGSSPGSCRFRKTRSARSSTKSPLNSPSDTSRSANSFWNASNKSASCCETDEKFSEQRQLLIGSYFLAEYSLESAALFNPSIVPHPDQTDLPSGALRFILSLRATGEGHISSITFRTGIIHADHRIEVHRPTGFLTEPRQIPNPLLREGAVRAETR